jgi:ABC-2 type transport system permease protein
VLAATVSFAELEVVAPLWIVAFSLLGGALFGALGMIAGIWSEKFDQLASFQNFLIMPLTMLSGVFYSIHSLPEFWQGVSHYNPVFYMIDGFRYGFFGVSDVAPETSLAVVLACFTAVSLLTLRLLKQGWKLRA